MLSFVRKLLVPKSNTALKNEDFETEEKLQSCRNTLEFLWTIDFKYEAIGCSKSRLITSSHIFNKWTKKIHEKNLMLKRDNSDQERIRSITLNDIHGNKSEVVHDLHKLDKDRDGKRLVERILSEENLI